MTVATRMLWETAGCPTPIESNGLHIEKRKGMGHCSSCGEKADYSIKDAISDNFTTVYNDNRSRPFGGSGLCAGCLWAYKNLALRNTLWFAKPGVGFWMIATRPSPIVDRPGKPDPWNRDQKPDPLSALLNPPEPPFIAGWGRSGIDHGGENNAHRFFWPGYTPQNPCSKIQSKHTAAYVRVSASAERYHLQVDDASDFIVDVPLWRRLRECVEPILIDLRGASIGVNDCIDSLVTRTPPQGLSLRMLGDWHRRTEVIESVRRSNWWPLFLELLPMPDFVQRPKTPKAPKPPKPEKAKAKPTQSSPIQPSLLLP